MISGNQPFYAGSSRNCLAGPDWVHSASASSCAEIGYLYSSPIICIAWVAGAGVEDLADAYDAA